MHRWSGKNKTISETTPYEGEDDILVKFKKDLALSEDLSSDEDPVSNSKPTAGLVQSLTHTEFSRGRFTLPGIESSRRFLKWTILVPLAYLLLLVAFANWGLATVAGAAESLYLNLFVHSYYLYAFIGLRFIVDVALDGLTLKMLKQGMKRVHLPAHIPRLTHAVVLCQYKEPMDILNACVESLADTTLAKSCVIVLACEARDDSALEKFELLKGTYGHRFQDFIMTSHRLQPGEVAGKGSNENYAVRELYHYAKEKGLDPFSVMVTVCDADSIFDSVFLEQLEAEYCRQPDGRRCIYETPVNTYRNTPLCNLLVQMVEINRCNFRLFWKRENPIAFSNYALMLGFAHELNYWDPGVIAEDVGINLKAMCFAGEGTATFVRVWSIILNDSVCSLQDRWTQAKRHMWCIELIPWTLSLYPVLRLRPWLYLVSFILTLDLPGAVPGWLVFVFPGVYSLFALQSIRFFVALQLFDYFYNAVRAIIRDMVMRKTILAHRKHYMPMTFGQQALLMFTYPFISPFASFMFYSCAIWRQVYHAIFHESITYITAPKALNQPVERKGSEVSSGSSTEDESFDDSDDSFSEELTVELLSKQFETRKRTGRNFPQDV